MPRRWLLLALWGLVLVVALALAVLAALEDRLAGDLWLTLEAHGWALPSLLNRVVRTLGDVRLLVPVGVLLAAVIWVKGDRRFAIVCLVAVLALQPSQMLIKQSVDRPRPPESIVEVRGRGTSPSFPAGHVMSPTLVYGLVAYAALRRERRRAAWVAALLAVVAFLLIQGAVNVHLGVHWPSDALGGYLWGLTLLLPAIIADRWPEEPSTGGAAPS